MPSGTLVPMPDGALRLDCLPDWLPDALLEGARAKLASGEAVRFTGRLTAGERRVYYKRRPMRPSDWPEKHRVLSPTESVHAGRWRNATSPHLTILTDVSLLPGIELFVAKKCVQSGVTEMVHNCIGWCIDYEPGPVMYVFPDKDMATDNAKDRILPMIRNSRRLSGYLTGSVDDEGSKRIGLTHMNIFMAWAHSASRLANKPVRHLVLDEINKFPKSAGKGEAGPRQLAEARQTTYSGFKREWILSTPTVAGAPIDTAYQETEVKIEFWFRCPHCMQYHLPNWKNVRWPDDADVDTIYAKKLVWYVCPGCGACWDDRERVQAVRLGEWREVSSGVDALTYLRVERGRSVGAVIPGLISPFVKMFEGARKYLRGQRENGDPDWMNHLRDWATNYMAEEWQDYGVTHEVDAILALRDDRPRGVVPGGGVVSCMLGLVDTQDKGFWYEVRAYGWGQITDSWGIREGYVETWEALEAVLWGEEADYRDAEGNAYAVRWAFIDSQGHRTMEVYEWAMRNRGRVMPCMGQRTKRTPWALSTVERFPNGKAIPGGIRRLDFDTNLYKSRLSSRLTVPLGDPGSWRLNSETTADWAAQMCSEYVDDETGYWTCPKHKANHAWDVSVLGLLGPDFLGIRFWKNKDQGKAPKAWQGSGGGRKENPFTRGTSLFGGRNG